MWHATIFYTLYLQYACSCPMKSTACQARLHFWTPSELRFISIESNVPRVSSIFENEEYRSLLSQNFLISREEINSSFIFFGGFPHSELLLLHSNPGLWSLILYTKRSTDRYVVDSSTQKSFFLIPSPLSLPHLCNYKQLTLNACALLPLYSAAQLSTRVVVKSREKQVTVC